MPTIKTPDQRVRVFVSSTLQELRSERIAAKEAITKLRLIPVLFESGARPHPPRDLYRAYLDQSHVFVGIYWNSYGWVAPDMSISGIEDEFLLSEGKARLIYVKHSDQRQPELEKLLGDIQKSDSVTFQKFETIEELRELVENDLALLLSERFDQEPQEASEEKADKVKYNPLPFMRSILIGREKELKQLREILSQSRTGLVTMTGAGGTGKTRLAVELVHEMKEAFPAGVCFVPLAAVSDSSLVVPAIANALGLLDTGHQPIHETLIAFLFEKKLLLLLDNFEQVVEAGPVISEVLSRCPLLKILITSRTPLQIRDERIYPVTPLALPGIEEADIAEVIMSASVRLFIERARNVNPVIELTPANVEAINRICRKLDGLPLAIELAAARTRVLSPVALLDRMDQSLDILSHGPRDLPQRHQTMRATIDWSYNLLDENDCVVLRHLSVFSDGWTLEAAEAVIRGTGIDIDILDYTDRLLNAGLIFPVEHDPSIIREQRFNMLQTVREYAQGILAEMKEAFAARSNHAEYFLGLLDHAKEILWDKDPIPSLLKLDTDYQNISLAFAFFHESRYTEKTWRIIGALVQYWSARGRFSEAFAWMDLAQIMPDTRMPFDLVSAIVQGDAFYSRAVLTLLAGKNAEALVYCQRSIELYQTTAQWQKMARAQTYLGSAAISIRDPRAIEFLHEALRLGETYKDEYSFIISSAFLGEVYTAQGDLATSFGYLSRAEAHARKQPQQFTLAITLLQKANYYLIQNDVAQALEASQESVAVFELSAFKSMKGWAQGGLGQCYLMAGDLDHAQKYFNQCLRSGREAGDRSMQLHSILGTASIAFMKKDLDTAATLCGSIEAMLARNEYATWSTVKKLFTWLNQQLTTNMPEPGLTEAKTRGSQLSFEQTVALVSAD